MKLRLVAGVLVALAASGCATQSTVSTVTLPPTAGCDKNISAAD